MVTSTELIGISIGVFSYSCLYLGKGIQKFAINDIQAQKSLKKKNSGIWMFGTVLTIIPMILQWIALAFAPINLITPLEGLGLIVLGLFSYYKLKESLKQIELIGIGLIVVGTIVAAFFASTSVVLNLSNFNSYNYLVIFLIIIAIEILSLFLSTKFVPRFLGIVWGFIAGTMMAFQSISKRISIIPEMAVWGTVLTLIFAPLTLLFTQVGFTKAKANQVVSCFTSASIMISTIASLYILNETMNILQMLGIFSIVIGVILLTFFEKKVENPNPK